MAVPAQAKTYHVYHADCLPPIVVSTGLWSDAALLKQALPGTFVAMNHIKQRRLLLSLASNQGRNNRLAASLRPYARANLDLDEI
ncbi:DarT ssDNA thymidine ADP-ribosyltransferase family protein [Pseudomonas sp. SIMBA_059]